MLTPPTVVFIVYGHHAKLREATLEAFKAMKRDGFRVRPTLLDETQLTNLKTPSIYEALRRTMTTADAAVVLATADDLGGRIDEIQAVAREGGSAEDVLQHLKPRARQNVILELGMLLHQVGDQRLLILTDREAEPPSDLVGRFWEFIENEADAAKRVRRFVRQTARQDRRLPLTDDSRVLSFEELEHVSDIPLTTFSKEFTKLDSPEDRALYLAERLVFDSYIQSPSWWRARLNEIMPNASPPLRITKDILDQILAYMHAWMPPDRVDHHGIELVCRRLEDAIARLSTDRIALHPAIRIAAYNYLGLAKGKAAKAPHLQNQAERLLRESLSTFEACLELTARFDDERLKLWHGYSLFNSARILHELMQYADAEERVRLRGDWRTRITEAIDVRSGWRTTPLVLPSVIRDGLTTEYFHAVAERIVRAERDESGAVSESGPLSIDLDWIAEKRQEFQEWWDHPQGLRVRLAAGVKESWNRIDRRGRPGRLR